MTREQIIEYLYSNNVKADISIEDMADDLAEVKAMTQMSFEDCISRQAANDFNRVAFLMAHMGGEEE